MYFECHYIDTKTSKVVRRAGVTHTLQKINGQWLITDSAGLDRDAQSVAAVADGAARSARGAAHPPRRWAALGGIKDRLVRVVARVPATVRTKLLVAFLGIAALLVLVAVLGLQVLGQANARVERLGTLQLRVPPVPGSSKRTPRPAADARRAGAGAPAVTPYTGGKTHRRAEAVAARRSDDRDTLLRRSSSAFTEPRFGFVPPPADERKAAADPRSTIERSDARSTRIQKLDGSGRRGLQGRTVPARRARRGRRPPRDRDEPGLPRPATETEALVAGEPQRVHVVAEPLHRRQRRRASCSRSASGSSSPGR